jgi:PEP-CTERM motif
MRRFLCVLVLSLAVTAGFASPASASAILVGTSATVSLFDIGAGFNPLQDTVTVVSPAAEIKAGDSTNIGQGALITGEFINIEATSIEFSIFGGGGAQGTAGYQLTGYDPGAHYVISDLFNPSVAKITGVSILLNNIVDVALGSEVFFDDHSVTLDIDTLGVKTSDTGAANLGTVTLNLTVQDVSTSPVPEPASLTLLVTGLSAFGVKFRLRRRQDSVRSDAD